MTYPTTLDNISADKTNATSIKDDHAGHHNALANAVNAIEAELGTSPSASYADVKARLDGLGVVVPRPNGVNDTASIQGALDAGGPGSAIFIPDSVQPYFFTTFRFYSNQTIRGFGQRRTELRQIAGTADIMMGPTDPTGGYKYLLIEDLYLNAQLNSANIGGLLLEGVQHSDVNRVQVGSTNNYAFRVLGKGIASSGDAMFNRFTNAYASNMLSGYGWQISPAPGGGSHPDATRLFGCDVIGSFGTAYRIDPASADTAGFLAADSCLFSGCTAQQMPTVFDIRGGQGHKINDGRYERTGSAGTTMTVNIVSDTPTNNPIRGVVSRDNTWASHGVAADLIWNDPGNVVRRTGDITAGTRCAETYPSMAAAEAINGSMFLDSADNILKYKDPAGVVHTLY